ncbi:chloride channel protein [Egibacter rhizosphaerae]|uniref:chloride channel protein n=1 Tax=Egibacter rhizosphaerae TaxID=1670831 RepID=UPI00197AB19D|nr:chloride channel protein [Egibacter rhizosphaerae]
MALLHYLLKWAVLGTIVGVLAGLAAAVFLLSLAWVTETREGNPWLLAGLPLGGFAVALAYHYLGGNSASGNNLILDAVHEPEHGEHVERPPEVPLRMAPLVLTGTLVTHLFGGSAGREGTGVQMSGALAATFARITRLSAEDRRIVLIASIAGGFGGVFQVPMAGTVFALEALTVGRIRFAALMPAMVAGILGDGVARTAFDLTGLPHGPTPTVTLPGVTFDPWLLGKVALAGIAFGLAAILFSELVYGLRRTYRAASPWAPARPIIGGLAVIALAGLVGTTAYLGLSLPLIADAYEGEVAAWAFLLKIVFTAVTIAAGFQGGEVTPLFVIGATLGGALAEPLDAPPEILAAIGLVAVFAGATNTPLASTLMGVELFGGGALVYLAVGCVISYVFTGHRGIYESQRIDSPKGDIPTGRGTDVRTLMQRRRPWLPPHRGRRPRRSRR